jgi:hypothetical protein
MEPEMVAFLKRVGKSLMVAFFWLAITVTAAVKGDNAFVGDHITIGNVLFYIWFIISIVILLWILRKMWFGKV